jgi:DNA-binding response OmpR family regulator
VPQKMILVVEDEPLVGLELKEGLEKKGYVVPDVIEAGEEFAAALSRYQPDLVLMDIHLRGKIDGVQAAARARTDFDVPVIYLTAYSDSDTLRRAAETDPSAFLLKPFDEQELSANIQIALSRTRGGDTIRRELLGALSLVDALEDPALITDTSGRIAHLNGSAARILNVADPSELARVPLSYILDLPQGDTVGAVPGTRINRRGSLAVVASMERLLRFDGTEYGTLVLFGSMQRRESRLLENSANEANSTLISYLPAPGAAGAGYRVGGFLEPCICGSGNFYDVFPAGEDKTAFYSLDVLGHGIIASLIAFSLHDLIPHLGSGSGGCVPSPAEVLRALYSHYYRKGVFKAMFFTITYGIIDNATGAYRAVRGGHTPLMHLSADSLTRIHNTKGAAVGIVEDTEIEEADGILERGDRLFLASDGLAEAWGRDASLDVSLDGIRGFAESFRNVDLGIFVNAFRREAKARNEGRVKEDDMSLLVIERQRDTEPAEALPVFRKPLEG